MCLPSLGRVVAGGVRQDRAGGYVVIVAGGNSPGLYPGHPVCWVQGYQPGVRRMGSFWDVDVGEA